MPPKPAIVFDSDSDSATERPRRVRNTRRNTEASSSRAPKPASQSRAPTRPSQAEVDALPSTPPPPTRPTKAGKAPRKPAGAASASNKSREETPLEELVRECREGTFPPAEEDAVVEVEQPAPEGAKPKAPRASKKSADSKKPAGLKKPAPPVVNASVRVRAPQGSGEGSAKKAPAAMAPPRYHSMAEVRNMNGVVPWLGVDDTRAPRLDTSELSPSWNPVARRGFSVAELRDHPCKRPDVERFLLYADANPQDAEDAIRRWWSDGPLYEVPAEYHCDRTFVTAPWEAHYVEEFATLSSAASFLDADAELASPLRCCSEAFQYPFPWQGDTRRKSRHAEWVLSVSNGKVIDYLDWQLLRPRHAPPTRVYYDSAPALPWSAFKFATLPGELSAAMSPLRLTVGVPPILRFFGIFLAERFPSDASCRQISGWMKEEWMILVAAAVQLEAEVYRRVYVMPYLSRPLREVAKDIGDVPMAVQRRVAGVARFRPLSLSWCAGALDNACRSEFRESAPEFATHRSYEFVGYDPVRDKFYRRADNDPTPLPPDAFGGPRLVGGPAASPTMPGVGLGPSVARGPAPRGMPESPLLARLDDAFVRAEFGELIAGLGTRYEGWDLQTLLSRGNERLRACLRELAELRERDMTAQRDLDRVRRDTQRLRNDRNYWREIAKRRESPRRGYSPRRDYRPRNHAGPSATATPKSSAPVTPEPYGRNDPYRRNDDARGYGDRRAVSVDPYARPERHEPAPNVHARDPSPPLERPRSPFVRGSQYDG